MSRNVRLSLVGSEAANVLRACLALGFDRTDVRILVEEKWCDESYASAEIAYETPEDHCYFLVFTEGAYFFKKLKDQILALFVVGIFLREKTLVGIVRHAHIVISTLLTYKLNSPQIASKTNKIP